jgi:putative ABC transport system permease protein
VSVADPTRLSEVLDFTMIEGSLRDLGADGLAVSQSKATDKGWQLGSVVPVTFIDGTSTQLTVRAIYDANSMVGSVIVPRTVWTPHALQDTDVRVLIALKDGADVAQARAAITPIADRYGSADVQDREEYAASVTSGLDLLLGIVYVMLALAIVIALMGIANTLALSIYERRHELGLLRAVGQTQRQARATVRLESVIIAVFGTIGGAALGVALGWGLVGAASGDLATKFALPAGQLVVVVVLGALAGVIAALRPARRAARMPILEAIAAR